MRPFNKRGRTISVMEKQHTAYAKNVKLKSRNDSSNHKSNNMISESIKINSIQRFEDYFTEKDIKTYDESLHGI